MGDLVPRSPSFMLKMLGRLLPPAAPVTDAVADYLDELNGRQQERRMRNLEVLVRRLEERVTAQDADNIPPDLFEEIAEHSGRFAGVHVNDWRDPTRGWADRVLPGDGIADVPAILGALDRAGWDGFYDLEIFSDNGAFGNAYEGSLWDVQPTELAARSRESFTQCWERRTVIA